MGLAVALCLSLSPSGGVCGPGPPSLPSAGLPEGLHPLTAGQSQTLCWAAGGVGMHSSHMASTWGSEHKK